MESNHHVPYRTQAPQACASTSSATAAWGDDSRCSPPVRRAPGPDDVRDRPGLRPSAVGASLANRCSNALSPAVLGPTRRLGVVDLDLTKRQKEIFDFIRRYAEKTGYPPTVREIGKAVGLHSSSTVHDH